MFVYVRLIDSQEQQYPNKKPSSNNPEKNRKQDPEKPTGHPTGIQDPKKDRRKPMFLKTVHRS
jgi:hypothetical protein